ncbi:MAG: CsoS2 family carboxysome shell protein [Gammaproteobacteria bacterium]
MAQTAMTQSAREASLARRRALTSKGKAAIAGASAAISQQANQASTEVSSATTTPGMSARTASRARREAMSTSGKAGIKSPDRTREASADMTSASSGVEPQIGKAEKGCGCGCNGTKATCDSQPKDENTLTTPSRPMPGLLRKNIARSSSRAASLARREAMSARGKAGINTTSSSAQTARAANPHLSSRELAKTLREQRSRQGKSSDKKSQPCGRMRPNAENKTGAAEDASWKVGASETALGQTLTGTMVGRSQKVTGDEPSTCRSVTGTDYMGADIFREFCQGEPGKSPRKVEVTTTSHGNTVSGNKIGRDSKVTGDEPGTCKRVTGNEYVGAKQVETFCGAKSEAGPSKITSSDTRKGKSLTGNNVGRSEKVTGDETGANRELTGTQYMQPGNGKAPDKVGISATLRGGSISGTMVGRNQRVTGDEPGSCRDVTGDDYIGQEQYSGFCEKTPSPQDRKVGVSETLKGKAVTGTLTDRSGKVTGDEPGTCKAVTGTPYASADQYTRYCKPEEAGLAAARTRQQRGTPGPAMTGQQPAIGGNMTGDSKGACESVSGTPYIGADQFAQACPATAADTNSPDFPQVMGNTPWGQFSVTSPSGGAQQTVQAGGVTGSRYEQGHITGPFGMATGKVTGTEEARFGQDIEQPIPAPSLPATAEMIEGRVKSRISGEGMDAGARITGDDWDRGDNVTGTEGLSAKRRNPTIRSNVYTSSIMQAAPKRNEEMQTQVSKVTGGSGNTEKGSLITYSGGARG